MIKKVAAKTHSFILRKKWKMKSDAGASLLGGGVPTGLQET